MNIKKVMQMNTNKTIDVESLLHTQRILINDLLTYCDDENRLNTISSRLCDMETLNRIISDAIDKQDMNLSEAVGNMPTIQNTKINH